jgi:hypothetical protein
MEYWSTDGQGDSKSNYTKRYMNGNSPDDQASESQPFEFTPTKVARYLVHGYATVKG